MRTWLDLPVVMATAEKVPVAPFGSDPAQPDGLVASRFHEIVSMCGTPVWNWTGVAADDPHVEESHTTWPCLVTTTRTDPAPYGSWHGVLAVDTAYTSKCGRVPWL